MSAIKDRTFYFIAYPKKKQTHEESVFEYHIEISMHRDFLGFTVGTATKQLDSSEFLGTLTCFEKVVGANAVESLVFKFAPKNKGGIDLCHTKTPNWEFLV